jgi:hypothetical protein
MGLNLTINVPVVSMVRDVMIFMLATPFRGPLERVGPENLDFFWAQKSHYDHTVLRDSCCKTVGIPNE